MKGFGYFLLIRKVIVLYQKGYTVHRFRLGKCVESQFESQEIDNIVLSSTSDILVACPIQEVYIGEAPRLKYLDRSAFLFHTLNHRFKSSQWIASRWLSATTFISLKFSSMLNLDFDQYQSRIGAFLGEITRFHIFKDGEGCLLAPTRLGQVYEIYLKNNQINFVRLINQDILISADLRDAEIESLKRYLERHFQANLQTLLVKWWGPNPPPGIEVYQTQCLEESIVQNYVAYIHPALAFKSTLYAHWFQGKNPLKKLKILVYGLSLILLLFSIKNSFDLWDLKDRQQNLVASVKQYQKKYQPFERIKETAEQIKEFKEKEVIVEVVAFLKPLMSSPLQKLKKISFHLKDQVRCHELIWIKGKIIIDSLDHTLVLHPTNYEHKHSSQSLILALTAPSTEVFQSLEKRLQKEVSTDQRLKIWTKPSTQDASQSYDVEETLVSALLEIIEKP